MHVYFYSVNFFKLALLSFQVPFVGDNLLAPALCIGADVVKRTWEIAQYPIPSPSQVRDSVEYVMTGTKWVLTTAGREIFLYVKRADANITRTLSHTRWKVLGSGPYATLDKLNKREVIDHLCERYFSLVDAVARYELAAHIRVHNRPLYHDLVLTGLLRQRGGDLTSDDEWLSTCPSYRSLECPFFLHEESLSSDSAFARWFRLPNENGKRPTKDTPWICFSKSERIKLERHYRSVLRKYEQNKDSLPTAKAWDIEKDGDTSQRYATNAKWYRPDLENDLLLDQKRHAVSFFPCCPKCRRRHDVIQPPRQPKQFGELCDSCSERTLDAPWVDTLLSPPPLIAVYRPTMWRFYGPGDELRRTAWFLDTQRRGLQPYGEDAQAVLEDAYLFLKWMTRRRVWDGSILLTVEVPSPDGSEKQLVQFSSLYSATAIGKGLGSAISLFKRRVYRGSYFQRSSFSDNLDSATDEKETNHHAASFADGDHDGHSPTQDKNSDANTFEFNNDVIADSRDPPQTNEGWVDINPEDQKGRDMSKQEIDAVPGPNREDVEAVDLESANSDARPKNEAFLFSELLEEPLPLAVPCAEPAVDADNDEESDSIDHLVLIIHGIGEMMQTIDFFGLKKIPTIVDCCAAMRKNHNEVLGVRFNQLYETLDGIAQPRKGRVEYLPVEWHEAFTIQSQRKHHSSSQRSTDYSINDVSLRTIPQLRQFANDTLMDVLYFMSPEHHDMIIDIVVNEMNFVVEKFRELTNFSGEISVVGHSLGSIITWDILDNQSNHATQNEGQGIPEVPQPPPDCNKCNNDTLLSGEEHHEHQSISRDKECSLQSSPTYPHLSFDIDNAFMLGSPIAVFLMIRNQQKPLSTDFTLNGCSRVFNIFHPYDPVGKFFEKIVKGHPRLLTSTEVHTCREYEYLTTFLLFVITAYRIEPLLDPRNAEIEPKIMPHCK